MVQRLVVRRVALLGIVVLFLAACGGSPNNPGNPTILSLTGVWRDTSFVLESCGVTGTFGLELDLEQQGQNVTGSARLDLWSEDTNEVVNFVGQFEGKTLTGTASYPIRNNVGEVTAFLAFNFTLSYQNRLLSGAMRSADFTCTNGSTDRLQSNLKLITVDPTPVSPDALEPNNLPSQAKSIGNGETLKDLTLSQGDVDWYTFSVTENSQATAVLELLTEFPVTITIFDESELVGVYNSQVPDGELQTQANLLDVTVAMTPGTYYIAVSASSDEAFNGSHSENGKYELSLTTRSIPLDANEFNNSPETATEITLDYSAKLSLYKGDSDWFKFTLPQMAMVTIDVSGTKDDFIYDLYESNATTQIFYHYQSAFPKETRALPAGTYYLKLHHSFGDITYPLKITAEPFADRAYEPNETKISAIPLSLDFQGETYLAPGDADWFRFTLSEERFVTLDLGRRNGHGVELFNEAGREFYRDYDSVVTLALLPDTYYLHFYNGRLNEKVSFSIMSKPLPDAMLEPNNTQATATSLTLPYQQNAYLQKIEEDWYTFTLTSTQLVTLNLGDKTRDLYYEIVKEGEPGSLNAYANIPVVRDLEAGVYYLRVAFSQHAPPLSGVSYSVQLTTRDVPDKAYEPNNSFNAAQSLTLPTTQDFYLTRSDEDWFKFTVSDEGVLSIRCIHADFHVSAFFYLYDAQQQQLTNSGLSTTAFLHLVHPGTYYLKVVTYSSTDAGAYNLSLLTDSLPDAALEPNDTSAQATRINLGFNRDMLVNGSNDDWFTFTLAETTQLHMTWSVLSQGDFHVYLTDARGIQRSLVDPVLEPGTYYIQITSYDTAKYNLSVVKK